MSRPLRWVLAPNPSLMTLDGTRTFIVGRSRPVVIDPGPSDTSHIRRLLAALDGAVPVAIILTHAHSDHSGAATELGRATRSPVWMAAGASASVCQQLVIDHVARHGDYLHTDAGLITIVATPGHAREHISLLWEDPERDAPAVFVGDLLMGEGDTSLVAPPDGDLEAYLASLSVIDRLRAEVLYPAHGEPLRDPIDAIRRYRRHRDERIEQVRRVLARHSATDLDTLVDRVYGSSLEPRLRTAAEGSLRAILQYLGSTVTPEETAD